MTNEAQQHNPQAATQSKQKQAKPPKQQGKLPPWARKTLRVLRILLVPILCLIALYAGLYIGYVAIGGQDAGDIWNIQTWKHVFDLMFAET